MDILVGFHGAGISNGAFLREGARVIEVFPSAFAAFGGFGHKKHAFLERLGLTRIPLTALETDPRCVERREYQLLTQLSASGGIAEHLRDCDVVIAWTQLRALF